MIDSQCIKCKNKAIGYIGLTGTKQEPYCQECINKIQEKE